MLEKIELLKKWIANAEVVPKFRNRSEDDLITLVNQLEIEAKKVYPSTRSSIGEEAEHIGAVMQRYLVSNVIFVEIKNGKITDKRGTEISTEFILQHEHYLGRGWGYVIL